MTFTNDESRALAFVAALLLLSAAVRLATLPESMAPVGAAIDLEAHIEATSDALADQQRRSLPLEPGERIDPNRASAAELDRLPGVGPRLATRIVAARQEGVFRTVDDLTRVPGIGARTVERLAPHLTLPGGVALGLSRVRDGSVARRGGPSESGRTEPAAAEWSVNLNTADAETLMRLPYVGPALAARILALRDSVGPFPSVDSLVRVKGIGPATLERLRARIRVR